MSSSKKKPHRPGIDPEATLTVTVGQFDPAGGPITDYTLNWAVTNGDKWLVADSRRTRLVVKARIPRPGPAGPVMVPPPGTTIAFNFIVPGFNVTDLPNFCSKAIEVGVVKPNSDGTASAHGVATRRRIPKGNFVEKYYIELEQTGSTSRWTIDPDFETDVTVGAR